jgi:biopolymer transport protein ExbD
VKTRIFLITILLVSCTVFAQKVDVPKKVQEKFTKLYPKTTEVKWSKEGKEEFEAEFKDNGKFISVVINTEGKLLETETKIDVEELPIAVESFMEKNYNDYEITEAAKIIDDTGVVTYEAEVTKGKEKKDLIFDKDGRIIVKKMEKSESEEKEEDED